jgi:hypothetical protein
VGRPTGELAVTNGTATIRGVAVLFQLTNANGMIVRLRKEDTVTRLSLAVRKALLVPVLFVGGFAVATSVATPAVAAPGSSSYPVETVLSAGPLDYGASLSPDGLWATYFRSGQLYSVPTAGGRERLLDDNPRSGFFAVGAITSDSSRIVYGDEAGLASQAIAGSPEVRLTDRYVKDVFISASGRAVMLTTAGGPTFELLSVPVEGGPIVRLHPALTYPESASQFVVHGNRVLFTASFGLEGDELYEVQADGSGFAKLSAPLAAGQNVVKIINSEFSDYVVYVVSGPGSDLSLYGVGTDRRAVRLNPPAGYVLTEKLAISANAVTVVAEGLNTEVLMYEFGEGDGSSNYGTTRNIPGIRLSPDGRWLVFTEVVGNATSGYLSALSADGGTAVSFSSPLGQSNSLNWGVSGNTIIHSLDDGGSGKLVADTFDRSVPTRVLAPFAAAVSRVTADGSLAVVNRSGSPWAVLLVGAASYEPIAPVTGTVDNRTYEVSPDGRRVIVVQNRVSSTTFSLLSFGPPTPTRAGVFVPLTPTRVLDTRPTERIASSGVKPAAGETVRLPIRGVAGVPNTADVQAVVLNVTAVDATAGGYVTVWPSGTTPPLASNVNVETPGQTRPNLVTVQLGSDGAVDLFTSGGSHLVADIAGYYTSTSNPSAGRMFPLPPSRVLDTRSGTRPGAGTTVNLPVRGRGGVPSRGGSAVILNVTATDAATPGFVTVWPTGIDRPLASNLNLERAGQTVPNQVIVPIGADGSVSLYTDRGTHLIADVAGWFTDSSELVGSSGVFRAFSPRRELDTRPASLVNFSGSKPARGNVVAMQDFSPIASASAVVANVTVADATSPGYVTVYPGGQPLPTASNLNADRAGQTIANHVTVAVGRADDMQLFTDGGTHLVVDISGAYYS